MAVRIDTWRIDQSADFEREYTLTDPVTGAPINLTGGWTAKAQIRPDRRSAVLYHELTSAGGTILLGADGKVTFKIDGSVSKDWTWIDAVARYDVLVTSPAGADIRMLEGEVLVSPDTTR